MTAPDIDKLRRQARIDSLLEATLEVFVEAGFEGLTVQRVADAAGIAKGTVYLYFDDRASLVAAAIWHAFEVVVAAVEAIAAEPGLAVDEQLAKIARSQLQHIEGQMAFYRALMRTPTLDQAAPERDPRHRAHTDLHQRVVRAVEGVLARREPPLADPREVAWAFEHLVHGAVVRLLTDPEAPAPERQALRLVELLLNGAAVAEGQV